MMKPSFFHCNLLFGSIKNIHSDEIYLLIAFEGQMTYAVLISSSLQNLAIIHFTSLTYNNDCFQLSDWLNPCASNVEELKLIQNTQLNTPGNNIYIYINASCSLFKSISSGRETNGPLITSWELFFL